MNRARIVLVVLSILMALSAPILLWAPGSRAGIFTLVLTGDVVGDDVVASVVMSMPGFRSPPVSVVRFEDDSVRAIFQLPSVDLRGSSGELLVAPTITVVLVGYDSNTSTTIIVPSEYILWRMLDPDAPGMRLAWPSIRSALERDRLAALRYGVFTIDEDEFKTLDKAGYVFRTPWVPGLGAVAGEPPSVPCSEWTLLDGGLGIYYARLEGSGGVPPDWFSADLAWPMFEDRLLNAIYYARADAPLNRVVERIAGWALYNNAPTWKGGAMAVSMSQYTLGGWRDSLPPVAYEGWVPLFSYSVENRAGEAGLRSVTVQLQLRSVQGVAGVSGLMVDGVYFAVQAASGSGGYGDLHAARARPSQVYYSAWATVYSPGDYLLVAWTQAGTVECNGTLYRALVTEPAIVSLYTLAVDFGRVNKTHSPPEYPALLAQPQRVAFEETLPPEEADNPLVALMKTPLTTSETRGWQASLGFPGLALATGPYAGHRDPLAGAMAEWAASHLGTGVVNAHNVGGSVYAVLELIRGKTPEEALHVRILLPVPDESLASHEPVAPVWGQVDVVIEPASPQG